MPYLKIWIHLVWITKNRHPFLIPEIRQKVFSHIKENGLSKDIYIDCINGYSEHVHCLISMNSEQNISKIMQLLKGESAFWINKNKLTKTKFSWQKEYFATQVSHSQIGKVRTYIKNQEIHHQNKTFKEEYDEFILKYNFEKIDN